MSSQSANPIEYFDLTESDTEKTKGKDILFFLQIINTQGVRIGKASVFRGNTNYFFEERNLY